MLMISRKYIVVVFIMVGIMCSCKPRKHYPAEPSLEFVSLVKIDNGTGIDDEAVLTVHYTDGDGDLGYNNNEFTDTGRADYYNFFITYYEKQNDVWVAPEELKNNFNVRLPRFLSCDNCNEAIDGNIEHILNINNYYSEYDTIRFTCYITDRAGHHSNTVTTPEVVVNK